MDIVLLAILALCAWLFLGKGSSQASGVNGSASPSFNNSVGAYGDPSDALDNFVQAIFHHEGGRSGDRNVVNNNPGNLRSDSNMIGTQAGYAKFGDVGDGWDALSSYVQRHVAAHPDWDFYDFFSHYLGGNPENGAAPSNQGDSDAYAEDAASYVGVDPTTAVSQFLGMS